MSAPASSWHADQSLLEAYARGTDFARASSVEQHLLGCARCRALVGEIVERAPLEAVWGRLLDEVHAPSRSWFERLLARLGLSEEDALLVRAAPAMRGSWLLALLLTALFAVVSSTMSGSGSSLVFVLLAPLVPVVGVGYAYGPDADPAWETTVATPYSALRLVLLRSGVVLAVSVPVIVVGAVALPGAGWTVVSSLVPALAGVCTTLALSTWVPVTRAAGGVAAVWVAATCLTAGPGLRAALDMLAGHVLPVYVVVLIVSGVVFWRRCDRLSFIGRLA